MANGDAAGGKKRKAKASVAEDDVTSPARHAEPRRGLGVAELERIRVALEMAERWRCYAAASSLSTTPHHQPPPEAHHQHVENGGVHQLQMTSGYLAQHYYGNNRLFTTNGGHPSSHHHQNHHSYQQNHYRQADQIQSAVTALPVTGLAASFESSSSASQRRQGHRRSHAKPGQTTALPQVAFVDLVDSDHDDNGSDVEELDLELKL